MKGIQNTSTDNFSTIIGNNKKFYVPRFQRDYSWDVEQWDDLWQDIDAMLSRNDEDHYMGYLVLQTADDKIHHIIDGQQRFSTIMILILAALKNIQSLINRGIEIEENKQRMSNLTNLYIGKVDPVSLAYDNILVLNKNNDGYYKDYIVKMDTSVVRGLSVSEKLMKKCFEFFDGKLRGRFQDGKGYAKFVQDIVERLYFTKIVVSDDLNAFRVFETLNARGVQLSSADLLKNYLFSLVDDGNAHGSHLEQLEQKWIRLCQIIRSEKLPEFLRYFWNCKHKAIRSKDVFKTIRAEIKTATDVFRLVDEMIRYSDVYMALMDKNDELWSGDIEVKRLIEVFNFFRLKQPFSVLMSAKLCLSNEEFKRVLKSIVTICFRYNVICDRNPNDQDAPFNALSMYIQNNGSADISLLDKIYISDSEFERMFAEKVFPYTSRNVKVIRYILGKIDRHNGSAIDIALEDENVSVEHILPQNYSENWVFDERKWSTFVDRLGNMSLLERTLNTHLQDASYSDKLSVYKKSGYLSSNEIVDGYPVWNEDSIIHRQQRMAKAAKSIWRI